MKRRLTALAAAGLTGAFLFAGPGLAGSGNGDHNDPGDAYTNKFDDTTAERECDTEGSGPSATKDLVTYAGPELLWPPNHKLGPPSNIAAEADDTSDSGTTSNDGNEDVSLTTDVTSDQPVNAQGDGNTDDDVYTADGESVQTSGAQKGTATTTHQVRAERAGTDPTGRTYRVDFTATFEDSTGTEYVCTSIARDPEEDPNSPDMDNGRRVVRSTPFLIEVPHDMSDPTVREKRNIGN